MSAELEILGHGTLLTSKQTWGFSKFFFNRAEKMKMQLQTTAWKIFLYKLQECLNAVNIMGEKPIDNEICAGTTSKMSWTVLHNFYFNTYGLLCCSPINFVHYHWLLRLIYWLQNKRECFGKHSYFCSITPHAQFQQSRSNWNSTFSELFKVILFELDSKWSFTICTP